MRCPCGVLLLRMRATHELACIGDCISARCGFWGLLSYIHPSKPEPRVRLGFVNPPPPRSFPSLRARDGNFRGRAFGESILGPRIGGTSTGLALLARSGVAGRRIRHRRKSLHGSATTMRERGRADRARRGLREEVATGRSLTGHRPWCSRASQAKRGGVEPRSADHLGLVSFARPKTTEGLSAWHGHGYGAGVCDGATCLPGGRVEYAVPKEGTSGRRRGPRARACGPWRGCILGAGQGIVLPRGESRHVGGSE